MKDGRWLTEPCGWLDLLAPVCAPAAANQVLGCPCTLAAALLSASLWALEPVHGWLFLPAGLLGLWSAVQAIWLTAARTLSQQRGFRAMAVLPAATWVIRQRLKGAEGLLASAQRVWEVHVETRFSWARRGEGPKAAMHRFFDAWEREWLELLGAARGRPVALVCSTYARLPVQVADLAQKGGFLSKGPLSPALLRLAGPSYAQRVQRRMFGGIVSLRDRREPTAWTTVALLGLDIKVPCGPAKKGKSKLLEGGESLVWGPPGADRCRPW